MATLGQAVSALEEQLFVGRDAELATFRHWLSEEPAHPAILNVSGPGGVGKTALLAAFRRAAARHRPVITTNASASTPGPAAFLEALGGGRLHDVVQRLNRDVPVLLLDGFDELGGLGAYLRDRFLPELDARVRIVIAGRKPLSRLWPREDVLQKLVVPIVLHALSPAEARTYLQRRGMDDRPRLRDQILVATRGHPLGLSLAADLAQRLAVLSLHGATEWPLVMRSLVERLHETEDPELRDLLECAALLRQFDEATLTAVAGRALDSTAFARICALSIVQPSAHGLALHDDVRGILAQDLRWRDPERYQALRERAVAHYRERVRRGSPADRAWVLCDRLFLSDHAPLQALLFDDERTGTVRVETARPTDHSAICAAWEGWLGAMPSATDRLVDRSFLNRLLRYPDTYLSVARDRQDRFLGFAAAVPVSTTALPMLVEHPALAAVLGTFLSTGLRTRGESTNIVCHTHVVGTGAPSLQGPTTAALLRSAVEVMAAGGVHVAYGPLPEHQAALELLGFEPISGATTDWWSTTQPTQGYVLDLTRTGVEPWTEALAAGCRPPKRLRVAEVEEELHRILPHWQDDAKLGQCGLWGAALFMDVAPEDRRAGYVREAVASILGRASADCSQEERFALRAVELAYLTPRVNHEAAAVRLAVSRATLYRMLKRGVRLLAEALTAPEDLRATG